MNTRGGWVRRGLVALGGMTGLVVIAGLAGSTFGLLKRLPEGPERSFYAGGAILVAIVGSLLIIFGRSWFFAYRKGGTEPLVATTANQSHAKAGTGPKEEARKQPAFDAMWVPIFVAPIFFIYMGYVDRVGDHMMELLATTHRPVGLMWAVAVTPIMVLLAIGERPEGARINWRTVIITAALWPAALLADLVASTASTYEAPARQIASYSGVLVMVVWAALGAAFGPLNVMFSLTNPHEYERKLRGLTWLSEGWSFRHVASFLAVVFGLLWTANRSGVPAFEGNPAYFAALFAGLAVALIRPRESRDWALAGVAGAAVAALILGGAGVAGWVFQIGGADSVAARTFVHLLLAVPGVAVAVVAVIRLGPSPARASAEHQ